MTGGSSKKKRNPDMPKRSSSSYIYFCKENRDVVIQANPNIKFTEITTVLSKMWSKVADKSSYEELAKKDKARYDAEMKVYNEKHSN